MMFALLKCLGSLKPNIFQTRRSRLHTLQAQKNPTFLLIKLIIKLSL